MAAEKKEKARSRKPSALKRDQQSLKKNLRNRMFKSQVASLMRSFKSALSEKNSAEVASSLNAVNSIMDKGVKKGIFKLNKASRVKSRLHAETQRAV